MEISTALMFVAFVAYCFARISFAAATKKRIETLKRENRERKARIEELYGRDTESGS